MAWVRASIPVNAVRLFGMVAVISGSARATFGASRGLLTVNLNFAAVSVMTEPKVSSLAVPAVVGTAMIGRGRTEVVNRPSYSLTLPPAAATMATALAQSMGLPPPTATRQSAPVSDTAAAAA